MTKNMMMFSSPTDCLSVSLSPISKKRENLDLEGNEEGKFLSVMDCLLPTSLDELFGMIPDADTNYWLN